MLNKMRLSFGGATCGIIMLLSKYWWVDEGQYMMFGTCAILLVALTLATED